MTESPAHTRDAIPTPVERGMWVSDCVAPAHIKSLLFVLAAHENNHTHIAVVAIATLVAGTGLSESAVHRAVRDAEAQGWIEVRRHCNSASHYSVRWTSLIYRKPTPRRSRRE